MSVYDVLRTAAVTVPRDDRFRVAFTGDKAREVLSGLLSADLSTLTPGAWRHACALTPKGRVIALVRVIDRGTDLLVDGDAAAAEGFIAMIRKYVNPRLAGYADVTATTGCVGVYGPAAAAALETALGANRAGVVVIASRDLAPGGHDCIGPRDRVREVAAALERAGVPSLDAATAEVARIEAGMPRWGVEMDDDTIPQEANLEMFGALAFDKGCYTGQEVVARIHFRGHVNRHLRWLTAAAPIPVGATVHDADGKEVGAVRSSVVSPARGPLAIAMVRREVAPGTDVTLRADGAELRARCEAIVP